MVDAKATDCHTIGQFYGVNGKNLRRQYRDYLSDFKNWEQNKHAKQWLVFPENTTLSLPYPLVEVSINQELDQKEEWR